MSTDGFPAGKTADGLVHYRLKDRSGKVFLCGTIVYQGLDVRFGEYAATCCNGVEGLIAFSVFIQSCSIRLQQGGHLVDEGTGTACADTVHTLFYITALEVDNLGILTAKLNCNIRFGGDFL